jgi:DNA-directed RNA polymerase subunit alpha
MPRIPFQKPKKVEWEILSDRYGRLVGEPFEKGYALTVGNSLRRTLLSIVPGAAVVWVKVDGVRSAETRIPGVTESTVDVLLNLKKLSVQVPSQEPRVVRLEATGPKTVKGEDVPEHDVEIMNPEVTLFTVEAGAKVSMELGSGWGGATTPPAASESRFRRGRWRSTRRSRRSPGSATTSRCRGSARSPTTRSSCSRSGRTAP